MGKNLENKKRVTKPTSPLLKTVIGAMKCKEDLQQVKLTAQLIPDNKLQRKENNNRQGIAANSRLSGQR